MFIVACCFTTSARSGIFEWIDPANTQILVIRDARVDFALRISAISRARHSIDSATFSQSVDPVVGGPLIAAFRAAANRGVQQRHFFNRMGSILFDPMNKAQALLADATLQTPPTVLVWPILQNIAHGLSPADHNHEKILLIDHDTPNELVFLSGRNHSQLDLGFHDLTFVIRRIDNSKTYLGDQIQEAYDTNWNHAANLFQPISSSTNRTQTPTINSDTQRAISQLLNTSYRRSLYAALNSHLQLPVTTLWNSDDRKSDDYGTFEGRPSRIRLATNDFLPTILRHNLGPTFRQRRHVRSPIHDLMAETIASGTDVDFSSMIFAPPPQIFEALRKTLLKGSRLTVRTNSRQALAHLVPGGLPFDLSVEELLRLATDVHRSTLDIKAFDPSANANVSAFYSHQKLLVTREAVIGTSDNGNETSRVRAGEIAFHAEGESFASGLRRLLFAEQNHYRTLDCNALLTESQRNNTFRRLFNYIGKSVY